MRIIKRSGFPIPRGMDAITIGSWIFIRPDAGVSVLPHEIVHVEQFQSDWLFPIKYIFKREYRYKAEIEAYKVSIQTGLNLHDAVYYLLHNYGFHKTEEEIKVDLEEL